MEAISFTNLTIGCAACISAFFDGVTFGVHGLVFFCPPPLPKIKWFGATDFCFLMGELGKFLTQQLCPQLNSSGTPGSLVPVQEVATPAPGGILVTKLKRYTKHWTRDNPKLSLWTT